MAECTYWSKYLLIYTVAIPGTVDFRTWSKLLIDLIQHIQKVTFMEWEYLGNLLIYTPTSLAGTNRVLVSWSIQRSLCARISEFVWKISGCHALKCSSFIMLLQRSPKPVQDSTQGSQICFHATKRITWPMQIHTRNGKTHKNLAESTKRHAWKKPILCLSLRASSFSSTWVTLPSQSAEASQRQQQLRTRSRCGSGWGRSQRQQKRTTGSRPTGVSVDIASAAVTAAASPPAVRHHQHARRASAAQSLPSSSPTLWASGSWTSKINVARKRNGTANTGRGCWSMRTGFACVLKFAKVQHISFQQFCYVIWNAKVNNYYL